jgi:adenylate cyclase
MLKKIVLSPWTALITLLVLLALRAADPSFVESVRLRYFDTLITSAAPTHNDIAVVNIDEAALDKWGQWPFPRKIYADIVKDLYARGAGLVVWNVLMPEADRFGGDAELAATFRESPVVLGNIPGAVTKNAPRKPGSAVINSQFSDRILTYPGIIANIPELEAPALGVGTVNTLPEIDGVTRRVPLVISVDGKIYPSLGMETLRVLAQDTTVQVKLSELGIDKMRIPKFGPISTDSLGRIWVDWSQTSDHYSITKLPEDFKGAVVIVGVSAAGLGNPVATAQGAVWPQDLQAAVLGTMINKVNIQRPDWADGAELLALAVVGMILIGMARWTYVGIGTMVVVVVAGVFASRWLYAEHRFLFDATALAGSSILVALHAYVVKFVSEFLQKQQIKRQFGTYLSPKMVEKLQENPDLLKLGGESRELSIMFTDVRGFTSISEHYGADVQGLTKIMNRYMTAMTRKILDNEGTLDKYIGDAQMAFWNAPLDDPEHARNAVRTALEMLGSLAAFNAEVTAEGIPPFGMGLGINTGVVVVGNMGSEQRFDYTCLGDSVNLASRLEGQSKPYHVAMVIGDRTNDYVKDEFFTLPLDCIAVKGKKEGVNIHTVLNIHDESAKPAYIMAKTRHLQMMADYHAQRFTGAQMICGELKGEFGGQMDGYYDMWIERCTEMAANPPGDGWDRVYRTNTK